MDHASRLEKILSDLERRNRALTTGLLVILAIALIAAVSQSSQTVDKILTAGAFRLAGPDGEVLAEFFLHPARMQPSCLFPRRCA